MSAERQAELLVEIDERLAAVQVAIREGAMKRAQSQLAAIHAAMRQARREGDS